MRLPGGKFSTILADPPWKFVTRSEKGRDRCLDAIVSRAAQRRNQPERHYATMAIDEIKALPVGDVAAKDCILLLWAIDPMLPQALEVGAAWGFAFKTVGFYWAKLRKAPMKPGRNEHLNDERKMFPMGPGYYSRSNPEQCLLFTRGRPQRLSASVTKLIAMDPEPGQRLIVSPRREHSRKPDEQYERIEALVAGPYLELFARTQRPGWAAWGDQAGTYVSETPSPASQGRRTDVFDLLGLSEALKSTGTRHQGRHADITDLIG